MLEFEGVISRFIFFNLMNTKTGQWENKDKFIQF